MDPSNGKGDKQRPTDTQKYRSNFDKVFGPSKLELKAQEEAREELLVVDAPSE